MAALAKSSNLSRSVQSSKSFASLLCTDLASLRSLLIPGQRLLGIDVSPTCTSFALSDPDRTRAYPWGLITRAKDAQTDARALMQGVRHAERLRGGSSLQIGGLLIGWKDHYHDEGTNQYLQRLIEWEEQDENDQGNDNSLFKDLKAILYLDQNEIENRSRRKLGDFISAAKLLPKSVERLRKIKYKEAMNPKELVSDSTMIADAKTRTSASDILQAALDDLLDTDA